MHRSILDSSPPMEPYRLFFPLGIVLGLFGVSVWPSYYFGLEHIPSAGGHVGLQIQGFVTAFSMGFLLTAMPKFVGAPPVRLRTQLVLAALLVVSAVGFWLDRPRLAEGAFVLTLLGLVATLARAFRARIAPPPEPVAAVALGLASGLAGALVKLLVVSGFIDPGLMLLGRRLLSEGMVLLFVIGIGGKLGPLLLGYPTRMQGALLTHGGAALVVLATIVAQYGFGFEAAAWLRAAVVSLVVARNVRFWRLPPVDTALSFGVWLAHVMVLAGLWLSAAFPLYRVEALHMVFAGGFSILILSVAMRVVLAHRGYPLSWEARSWPLRCGIALFALATLARVGAKFSLETYLLHLTIAGLLWVAGLLVWGSVLVHRILVPGPQAAQAHPPEREFPPPALP